MRDLTTAEGMVSCCLYVLFSYRVGGHLPPRLLGCLLGFWSSPIFSPFLTVEFSVDPLVHAQGKF